MSNYVYSDVFCHYVCCFASRTRPKINFIGIVCYRSTWEVRALHAYSSACNQSTGSVTPIFGDNILFWSSIVNGANHFFSQFAISMVWYRLRYRFTFWHKHAKAARVLHPSSVHFSKCTSLLHALRRLRSKVSYYFRPRTLQRIDIRTTVRTVCSTDQQTTNCNASYFRLFDANMFINSAASAVEVLECTGPSLRAHLHPLQNEKTWG